MIALWVDCIYTILRSSHHYLCNTWEMGEHISLAPPVPRRISPYDSSLHHYHCLKAYECWTSRIYYSLHMFMNLLEEASLFQEKPLWFLQHSKRITISRNNLLNLYHAGHNSTRSPRIIITRDVALHWLLSRTTEVSWDWQINESHVCQEFSWYNLTAN